MLSSWQRAEYRNRGTAQLYDELGLACYEAMEAFVSEFIHCTRKKSWRPSAERQEGFFMEKSLENSKKSRIFANKKENYGYE